MAGYMPAKVPTTALLSWVQQMAEQRHLCIEGSRLSESSLSTYILVTVTVDGEI